MSRNLPSYLYVWNDIQTRSVVASGLRFGDFWPALEGKGGMVLLKHSSESARRDELSGLDYVEAAGIRSLTSAEVYSWGDFYWADYSTRTPPRPDAEELADLAYFVGSALPRKSARIESLANDLLVAAHDDGWYVRAFYSQWDLMAKIIRMRAPALTATHFEALEKGVDGFWVQDSVVCVEEKTFKVDEVINRQLRREGKVRQAPN